MHSCNRQLKLILDFVIHRLVIATTLTKLGTSPFSQKTVGGTFVFI